MGLERLSHSLSLSDIQPSNLYNFLSTYLLLPMSCSTHSTCGVLCTVFFCLAGCARLPQNVSGCYCKTLEVKIKIGGGAEVARATLSYLIFGDSGSKSVDTGAVN